MALHGATDHARHVTENPERFRLFRLCDCSACGGSGREWNQGRLPAGRCPDCRGEGRVREELATCASPEAVGVALVTLAREGEWQDCPLGLLDSEGEKGKRWLILPWTASPRNVSDAGKLLRSSRKQ